MLAFAGIGRGIKLGEARDVWECGLLELVRGISKA